MATFQETFQSGLEGLSGRNIGIDPGKTSRALTVIKPQRNLPMRDEQGKFVERNTGLLLTALNKIQSTLGILVGLTKESLNIEKKDQLEDKTKLRGEKITAGETDIPPKIKDEPKDKGPGILGSMKGALGSAWAGMGTKTAFALVVGGLALLTKFSDDLVGPLTKLLEWIRDDMIPDIIGLWKSVKGWWFRAWTKVKDFFTTIKGIFTAIGNWMETFDLDKSKTGTLGLDPDEWQALVDSIVKKISDKIWSITGSILKTLLQAFTIYTVGSIALKTLMAMALRTGAPALAAGGAAAIGVGGAATVALGVAAIAAIIATGIWKLANNITTAWDDAVTDELGNKQDFSLKEFVTRLLVGKETGNKIQDVMQNAYDKMFIGAATGATIGGVMGAGVFSIPAAGFGAVIGALSGITIGALTAYYGKEAVDKQVENMIGPESPLMLVVNYITDMYKTLILTPFEFIFGKLGEANDSLLARLGFQFDRAALNDEEMYGENVNKDKVAKKSNEDLFSTLTSAEADLKALRHRKKTDPGWTPNMDHGIIAAKKIIKTVTAEIENRGLYKETTKDRDFLRELRFDLEESKYKNNVTMSLKDIIASGKLSKETMDRGFVAIGNKTGSDNTNVKTDNVYTGGFTYTHPNATARALAASRGFAVPGGFATTPY